LPGRTIALGRDASPLVLHKRPSRRGKRPLRCHKRPSGRSVGPLSRYGSTVFYGISYLRRDNSHSLRYVSPLSRHKRLLPRDGITLRRD